MSNGLLLNVIPSTNNSNNNNNVDDDGQVLKWRMSMLDGLESALKSSLFGNNNNNSLTNELKLTLYNTLMSLADVVAPDVRQTKMKKLFWSNFRMALSSRRHRHDQSSDRHKNDVATNAADDFIKQVLVYLSERFPKEMARLLVRNRFDQDCQWIIDFFQASEQRVNLWFQHFHYDGKNKYGALALERYMFANRDKVWHRLVWRKSPVPPPVAAQKREMLLQLDVQATMKNFLNDRRFWQDYGREAMMDGSFLVVDAMFFVEDLYDLLLEGRDRSIEDQIDDALGVLFESSDVPFTVLKLMTSSDLLDYCQGLIRQRAIDSYTLKLPSRNLDMSTHLLSCLVISCNWDSLEHLLLYNSITLTNINKLMNRLFMKQDDDDEGTVQHGAFDKLEKSCNQWMDELNSLLKTDTAESESLLRQSYLTIKNNSVSNSTKASIRFILLESFQYYFILKRIIPTLSLDQLETFFKQHSILYSSHKSDDDDIDTSVAATSELDLEINQPIISDDEDQDDDQSLSSKKRKKEKRRAKKQKRLKYFNQTQEVVALDGLETSSGFNPNNIQWMFPSLSTTIRFSPNDIPHLVYQIKLQDMMLDCLKTVSPTKFTRFGNSEVRRGMDGMV
ncbi:hypothetical protein SAMD00019534_044160 [Acytostelium subglobosum LB1]|uniref:hypothetical protein n=1 Tax=Acytostelium subglobosum LB1 TaxID=1410327 RepID=UPI00064510E2|nr:hypothetical protein SAMD00019534_044160 [Acytostelium subglobosum LB1]GAM21241.1 hypothetical protein SAMD00019534_044160 [Acytostelium subglobosum LB1]|eukprot:XP_012755360.1 hypothetical protein SAMD00019534_044160 [Acytostelium subglobosum LB1]